MSAVQHTPIPWSEPGTYGATKFEITGDGLKIAVVERIEDASHIVQCVNAHDELVAWVKDVLAWSEAAPGSLLPAGMLPTALRERGAAIAKATGST